MSNKKHINSDTYDKYMPNPGNGMRMAVYSEYKITHGVLRKHTVTRTYTDHGYSDSNASEYIAKISDLNDH